MCSVNRSWVNRSSVNRSSVNRSSVNRSSVNRSSVNRSCTVFSILEQIDSSKQRERYSRLSLIGTPGTV